MSYNHLNDHERYVIYHLNLFGMPKAEIARRLKRSASTTSREFKRNANAMGQYLYDLAEHLTRQRRLAAANRPRTDDTALMTYVKAKTKRRIHIRSATVCWWTNRNCPSNKVWCPPIQELSQ